MARKKSVKFNQFLGLNNVLQSEKTDVADLQAVSNYYVDDSGRLRRRDGYRQVHSGAYVHSLFSDGETILFREEDELFMLDPEYNAISLRSGLIPNKRMVYLAAHNRIYYTDGAVTGVVKDGVDKPWGIEIPTVPRVSETIGDLRGGRYQIALTYQRRDGQESGTRIAAHISISRGGIVIDDISTSNDPDVEIVNIYLAPPDGEILYKIGSVLNGARTITYLGGTTHMVSPLMTQHMSPPPVGHMLAFYNGRIYIAHDNIIWYTEAHNPEMVSLDHNFIPMEKRVTMMAPVSSGLWVGTLKETAYIMGNPPETEARYIRKATYGPIEGTQAMVSGDKVGIDPKPYGVAWLWTTTEGICLGGTDGFYANITGERVKFPDSPLGTATIINMQDAELYTVGLYYSGMANVSTAFWNIEATGTTTP